MVAFMLLDARSHTVDYLFTHKQNPGEETYLYFVSPERIRECLEEKAAQGDTLYIDPELKHFVLALFGEQVEQFQKVEFGRPTSYGPGDCLFLVSFLNESDPGPALCLATMSAQ